ncbi:hypothetical protein D3C75_1093460 [compost metagenome]
MLPAHVFNHLGGITVGANGQTQWNIKDCWQHCRGDADKAQRFTRGMQLLGQGF